MDVERLLSMAEGAAEAAGRLLASRAPSLTAVLSDEGRDVKLAADRESEAVILQALASSGLPVLTEESGLHGQLDTAESRAKALPHGYFWIVDPLDGTFNYQRGLRTWAVSIAAWHGTRPLAGVVYDPSADEIFSGLVGRGATLNGQPIRVGEARPASKAVLATGCPVNADYSDGALERLNTAMRRFKKVRMLGSAALSAAYVACGRIDAYAEDEIMLWDVAAGAAIVAAAGGVVSVRPSTRRPWATLTRLSSSALVWEGEAP